MLSVFGREYNRGIHGNILKLRISGFQALAITGRLQIMPQSSQEQDVRVEDNYPFALRKPDTY